MRKIITLVSLLFVYHFSIANELAMEYDKAIKQLDLRVTEAYSNADLNISQEEMLKQIHLIQTSFEDYFEIAAKIKQKFKEQDIRLFADLADLNPNYCKIESESDNTYTFLAIAEPALAPLMLFNDKEVVFKLKNYGDLRDMNDSLVREEFRIKKNKGKSKRYLRKLRILKEELEF